MTPFPTTSVAECGTTSTLQRVKCDHSPCDRPSHCQPSLTFCCLPTSLCPAKQLHPPTFVQSTSAEHSGGSDLWTKVSPATHTAHIANQRWHVALEPWTAKRIVGSGEEQLVQYRTVGRQSQYSSFKNHKLKTRMAANTVDQNIRTIQAPPLGQLDL